MTWLCIKTEKRKDCEPERLSELFFFLQLWEYYFHYILFCWEHPTVVVHQIINL